LTIHGNKVKFEVHVLVATAFLGIKPFPKAEVAHKDGNPRNNHYSNLSWKTHRDNEADKRRHGTTLCGERNPMAKLRTKDVVLMRQMRANHSLSQLAKIFRVSVTSVARIVKQQRWTSNIVNN
jgi:HNH endonuclease